MTAWPNTARPGEPADTARPWHWLARLDDGGHAPVPLGWNPAARQWLSWDGTALPPAEGVVEAAATETFSPVSAHSADMVPRRDAIRNHLLIFAGSVVATLFLAEKIVR